MYRSFLVRVWFEEEEQRESDWQAEVQQIQSGESWTFDNHDAFLAFFDQLPQLPSDSEGEQT